MAKTVKEQKRVANKENRSNTVSANGRITSSAVGVPVKLSDIKLVNKPKK